MWGAGLGSLIYCYVAIGLYDALFKWTNTNDRMGADTSQIKTNLKLSGVDEDVFYDEDQDDDDEGMSY